MHQQNKKSKSWSSLLKINLPWTKWPNFTQVLMPTLWSEMLTCTYPVDDSSLVNVLQEGRDRASWRHLSSHLKCQVLYTVFFVVFVISLCVLSYKDNIIWMYECRSSDQKEDNFSNMIKYTCQWCYMFTFYKVLTGWNSTFLMYFSDQIQTLWKFFLPQLTLSPQSIW